MTKEKNKSQESPSASSGTEKSRASAKESMTLKIKAASSRLKTSLSGLWGKVKTSKKSVSEQPVSREQAPPKEQKTVSKDSETRREAAGRKQPEVSEGIETKKSKEIEATKEEPVGDKEEAISKKSEDKKQEAPTEGVTDSKEVKSKAQEEPVKEEPAEKKEEPEKEKPVASKESKIKAQELSKKQTQESEAKKEEAATEKPLVTKETQAEPKEPPRPQIKLSGLFAFKMEMTSFYEEGGEALPVTALYYEPWRVSQIKTKATEGYSAVQLACHPQKNKGSSKPVTEHLKPAGFQQGARYIKELRLEKDPENIQVGHELSIESLKKGDIVKVFSRSKGRGFAGVVKRWGFRGGKASHGSKSHRRPGSIGQHTEPSRVFAGRKMPGHYGHQRVCLKNVKVVDVLPEESLIFVKGAVPGSRNTLVTLKKQESLNA